MYINIFKREVSCSGKAQVITEVLYLKLIVRSFEVHIM